MTGAARFEIMPFARGEEEAAALPESARLTVTCSPKHGIDCSVAVATRLRALGHAVFEKGDAANYFRLPYNSYAAWSYDKVLNKEGAIVGLSTVSGYSYNERAMLSLAMVEADVPIGAEVTLIWGEEGGGSARPVVARHKQVEIRAVVSPCPYSEVARTTYAKGWRTKDVVA